MSIEIRNYNLIFWRDGKKFLGKRVCDGRYVVYDQCEKKRLEISKYILRKFFETDEGNQEKGLRKFKK
jgi:hypothetical protein